MNAATVLDNVREVSESFAADRKERQRRRHLDQDDFARLAEAGLLLTGVPEGKGGLWRSVRESTRPICEVLRTLAQGDPSVALVSSMHPAVLSFWLAAPQVDPGHKAAWDQQVDQLAQSALDGHWWGTITSEPSSGGDITKTRAVARGSSSEFTISGAKHFGSGSGISSYMITTAVEEGGSAPDLFFMDVRDVPWDGSRGMKLIAEWDGSGMAATQSHAMEFENFPAVRCAWPGHLQEQVIAAGPYVGASFTAVIVGIIDAAIATARQQLRPRHESLRPYEQVEWSRAEMEVWMIRAGVRRDAARGGRRPRRAVDCVTRQDRHRRASRVGVRTNGEGDRRRDVQSHVAFRVLVRRRARLGLPAATLGSGVRSALRALADTPGGMTELIYFSATALASEVREKRVSSAEVVDAHAARIEEVNPKLNAMVQPTADNARRRARELDEELARGDIAGPLHGVPFTAKDWLDTDDAICAAGQPIAKERRPKHDATVVARMRSAGGVLLGKTFDGVGGPFNELYGTCHNPYDLDRTPGESSSGEASIIAAGGSPLGLGSDSGGSIRYPAHCSGVAGLKPSAGRVPLTGHFPRLDSTVDTRTQIGPLARTVEDLGLALSIIAGPDGRDPGVAPMALGDWRDAKIRGLRVVTFEEFPNATPDDDTRATVRSACQALSDAGAIVEESLPPRIDEAWDITMMYWARVESASLMEWTPPREHTLTVEQIERGMFAWGRLRREFLSWMQAYDAVVCPASPAPAMLISDKHDPKPFVFTLPFSLTGWPVVVVRAGTSNGGMPIGVQVAAQPWRDDVALAVARQIEADLGGWRPPDL